MASEAHGRLQGVSVGRLTTAMRSALFYFAAKNYTVNLVIDEFAHSRGLCDVVFVKRNRMMVEVEIKASIADLKREKKKACRQEEKSEWEEIYDIPRLSPNYFVFCIPDFLLDKALPIIESDFPKAGILTFDGTYHLKVARKMRKIHGSLVSDELMLSMVRAQSQKYIWKMWRQLKDLSFLKGRRLY
jgi:hypothetical protein